MRAALYLLTLTATLSSCAQHAATTGAATSATPATPVFQKPRTVSTIPINTAPGDTVLVFQRTPCYGTCPAYTATIFRNGQVSYFGDRFVPVTGQRTLSLPPATVTAMLDEARRINFNSLAPSYTSNVSDLPSTIITVYLPGQQRHRVLAEANIPAPLQGYIAYLKGRLDPLAGLNMDK
ncbi:hypothetical protein HHL22_20160 [Hymenobacter sp. RP-2-7]|uniref:DUF6438 domain-containing protein n=1 Tax=Hymenobacter polaris TaxID=2682546 RepID=A0A7Y0AHQ5_9BACT|nr:DUF6438 domain-containing protein [Hymenobacter polaris]NML67522.1 hypothetical protein [Hymenobacter polaris]